MGNFLDDLLKKIFRDSGKTPVNYKENFSLKEEEIYEINTWLDSQQGIELMGLIYKNIHFKRTQINESPQVHLFESPYANGFAVSYEPPLDIKSFSSLFLAFSRRILDLGYRQVSLDRKFEEINEQVKVTEKFYFKPPLQNPEENELISQLFGNISIEKVSVDNQPSYIKFLATVYSDRLYQQAQPYDLLIDSVFKTT
ncbi:hypothetical protein [Algoriphagus sp. CAU 1675]|uniref:hypothetical protein n=1 Tax=Algoriphagus sp. CAU 1675 TaxID=3032597 RepID=UPI0023D978DF|nr:hypothetical protein [Algoriphagus sp. CAU 1675]MDF2159040.1 hypothetical protein [Algoriphagus sp. CAU 1675]